jgi:hypothetical protein
LGLKVTKENYFTPEAQLNARKSNVCRNSDFGAYIKLVSTLVCVVKAEVAE